MSPGHCTAACCTWRPAQTSSMSGAGLCFSTPYMDITIPGEQNPHWEPWPRCSRSWSSCPQIRGTGPPYAWPHLDRVEAPPGGAEALHRGDVRPVAAGQRHAARGHRHLLQPRLAASVPAEVVILHFSEAPTLLTTDLLNAESSTVQEPQAASPHESLVPVRPLERRCWARLVSSRGRDTEWGTPFTQSCSCSRGSISIALTTDCQTVVYL